jgi:hypothetical protein
MDNFTTPICTVFTDKYGKSLESQLPIEIELLPRSKHFASTITMREHFALEIFKSIVTGRPDFRSFTEYGTKEDYDYCLKVSEELIALLESAAK